MAIKKKLIHFKNYSNFNSMKLSANEANTQYTLGVGGAIQNGSPDILYESICWIKDTKQQWTHGQLYDLSGGGEMPDLADVAFSGDYEDLSNKPTIPNGTITGVSANGTSVATSGVANIPAATTGKYGVTKLSSATNSTSTTLAATPSAVKSAYDLANGKYSKPSTGIPKTDMASAVQSSLGKADSAVQNISASVKTGNATAGNFFNVNKDANGNVTIQMIQNSLASGKIAIPYTTDVKQYVDEAIANAGGGGSTSGMQWTADVLVASGGTIQLEPFVVYYGGELSGENVTINPNLGTGYHYQEYRCIFYVSVATTMYVGVDMWVNGKTPEIKSNRWYELSIAFDSYAGITFGVLTEFSVPE